MLTIPEILKSTHTIAVVGLSNNHMRPSNGVGEYLVRVGYRVIPVNPNETEVLGEKAYPALANVPQLGQRLPPATRLLRAAGG